MSQPSRSLDELMANVFQQLCQQAKANASGSAQQVLDVSAEYLSKEAHESLKKFQELYFGGNKQVDQQKDTMNKDVDDLIDQIQSNLDGGVSDTNEISSNLKETDDQATQRLGLAAFQKQLESLIALEDGLRDKLAPVLASLQFDDAVSQRLDHVTFIFDQFVKGPQHQDRHGLG